MLIKIYKEAFTSAAKPGGSLSISMKRNIQLGVAPDHRPFERLNSNERLLVKIVQSIGEKWTYRYGYNDWWNRLNDFRLVISLIDKMAASDNSRSAYLKLYNDWIQDLP